MTSIRSVTNVASSIPTLEGAGVHLRRAFGVHQVPHYDPFLLLDVFHSHDPEEYRKGFPWHPHRGIETITYMLVGEVEHGDSMGNAGVIGAGDIQWMTAGNGIIHQEMPRGDMHGEMWGCQLWANLPATDKMMSPRYQEVRAAQIPMVTFPGDVRVKVIAGEVQGVYGPVRDIMIVPEYLDVTIPAGGSFVHYIPPTHQVFAYVLTGAGFFDKAELGAQLITTDHVLRFGEGEDIAVTAGTEAVRFLLVSGKPLHQPVAWYGPIVMNTDVELEIAMQELEAGTFVKTQA